MKSLLIVLYLAMLASANADPPPSPPPSPPPNNNTLYQEVWWTTFLSSFTHDEIGLIFDRLSGSQFQTFINPPGDSQCDGSVNVLDIVQTVNVILNADELTYCTWGLDEETFTSRACGDDKYLYCFTASNCSCVTE